MHNTTIRDAIKNSGVRYWQVAERYGCSDGSFSRKLRRELPESEKQRVLAAIKSLQEAGGAANGSES